MGSNNKIRKCVTLAIGGKLKVKVNGEGIMGPGLVMTEHSVLLRLQPRLLVA